MWKRIGILLSVCLVILLIWGSWWAKKNNPYSNGSWVKPFFSTSVEKDGQIYIKQSRALHVLQTPFAKLLMYTQALFRIEGNVYSPEKPFMGNEQQIIDQIHKERFDVGKPYVITGGHFAELYIRNFGIFYNAMLDPRIPTTQANWLIRQRVTLQTLATDLELLKQADKEYTTFIPVSSDTFVSANFNAPPSDSLFAIVYTLSAATDATFISKTLPTRGKVEAYPLQTKQAAQALLHTYEKVLTQAIAVYLDSSIDPQTGLVKKNIILASARDSVKRQSSFYDNVIAWATTKDAVGLGLRVSCPKLYLRERHCDIAQWKQTIINAFWDGKDGLFINDLSVTSVAQHTYTGEEFIVVPAGFLDLQHTEDKNKLLQMVRYVKQHNYDKPLPLVLAEKNDLNNYTNFFIRHFAASYMGESIWSHSGQEYIETLILLSVDYPELLVDAKTALVAYRQRIERYGGYPEAYDKNGKLFQTLFYKVVLRNGWIINYEQAKMLSITK